MAHRGRIFFWLIFFLCTAPSVGLAQWFEPIYIIDHPTAGLLDSGAYHFYGRLGPESSIITGLRIGFRGVFQIGASFGMQRLFDRGKVYLNDKVGFLFRVRLLEEYIAPALALGFDSQGSGFYHSEEDRYDRKSPGFYVVLSKNYSLSLGQLSLHGGANYSTEDKDENDPNLFFAVDWSVFDRLSFLLDTDAALNDNARGGRFGGGGVYLDAAVRLRYGDGLSLMVVFRDLTSNFRPERGVGREFEIAFWDSF